MALGSRRTKAKGGFYNCGCDVCVSYFGTEQAPTAQWIPVRKISSVMEKLKAFIKGVMNNARKH